MNKKHKIITIILCACMIFVAVFGNLSSTKPHKDVVLNGKDDAVQLGTSSKNPNSSANLSTEDLEEIKGEEDPKLPHDVTNPEDIENGLVEYSDDTLLVKVKKPMTAEALEDLKATGVEKLEVMFELEDAIWYVAYLNKEVNVKESLAKVRELNKVMVAEYNYEIQTASYKEELAENTQLNDLTYWDKYGISQTWDYLNNEGVAGGKSNIVVAVIDTGVDYTHNDLKYNMWVNKKEIPDNGIDDDDNGYVDDYYGFDATAGHGSAMDDNGHGTHVAGIIAASNNNEGVVGLAYNTQIMSVKAADASGILQASNITKAIIYAYENGASVINMSFGGIAMPIAVQDALATAYTRCVLVASAGNDGAVNENSLFARPNYPAAFSFVLGVMSVGDNNVESVFTNYDHKLYTSVEYEVYAPGEMIVSTIPGNLYAALSGTSMAAPVVAAQAALLRSYYDDVKMYPTKFIYGQIVGTADENVSCLNPTLHGLHNIPGVVNFYRSFTELPKPDLGMSEVTIFDSEEFISDKHGLTNEYLENNNGDGIIDSGEVIALGLTLKNRWGMSEDTIVSINATSHLGVDNPYVTFLNNNVNYGSIGTYSEDDCGKVYSEDGELWIGWENPFYLKVSKDCPNNYTITLNVTITYKNAIDKKDTTLYTTTDSILLTVRRGEILPNIIKEDTTLTKENFYIIPNSMIIMEGATLTIKEGTKVQFWSDDPNDAYADSAITYLTVNGNLIIEGTKEEPVEIFPSDLRSQYVVDITESGKGFISMKHAIVTNPVISASYIEDCEFNQNYKSYVYYRYLSDGKVRESYRCTYISADKVLNSVFYKLGSSSDSWRADLYGQLFEGNIFVDSNISFDGADVLKGNVFLGNNNFEDNVYNGATSELEIEKLYYNIQVDKVSYIEELGKTYVYIRFKDARYDQSYCPNASDVFERMSKFATSMGGTIAHIDDLEEFNYLTSNYTNYDGYLVGVEYDKLNNKATNTLDNTPLIEGIPTSIRDLSSENNPNYLYGSIYYSELRYTNIVGGVIIEITKEVLPTEIELEDYLIFVDTENVYTIHEKLYPTLAKNESLIYESEDESIAKVDEKGNITGISNGTTTVKVYSKDKAVYNYITVNVIEKVQPEYIKLKEDNVTLSVNNSYQILATYEPINATIRGLNYESSDESIATVNDKGIVTAHKPGLVTITVTGHDGLSAQLTVNCVIPVESITYLEKTYVTNLQKEDGFDFYPIVSPSNTTQNELIWESSNPEIAYVDQNGKLVKLKEGYTTLKVTVKDTTLSQTLNVVIFDDLEINVIKVIQDTPNMFVLTNEGKIWAWGEDIAQPQLVPIERNVIDFEVRGYTLYYIDDEFNLYKVIYNYNTNNIDRIDLEFRGAKSIEMHNNTIVVISNDGYLYATGNNNYGQLGDGSVKDRDVYIPVGFENKVKKVLVTNESQIILDENNDVYVFGTYGKFTTPHFVMSGVNDIYSIANNSEIYFDYDSKVIRYYAYDTSYSVENKIKENQKGSEYNCYYIENGNLYLKGYNNTGQLGTGDYNNADNYKQMLVVENVKEVFKFNGNTFVQTNDGKFYAVGSGSYNSLANVDVSNSPIPVRVLFGLENNFSAISLLQTNFITESSNFVLNDNSIILEFNESLRSLSEYALISIKDKNGISRYIKKTIDLNKLIISPTHELVDGDTYTLYIPTKAVGNMLGQYNRVIGYTFTYRKPVKEEQKLTLNYENVHMNVDYVLGLTAKIDGLALDDSIETNWTSNNPLVASVDQNGHVKANSVGKATITLTTSTGLEVSCEVTIWDPMDSIILNTTSIQLGVEETAQLMWLPYPLAHTSSEDVVWETSDEEIATIDKNGVVTGVYPGEVTINATSHGYTATCTVVVSEESLELEPIKLDVNETLVVKKDETLTITANTTDVVWTTNNPDVATIDENGVVTGISKGTVTVIATGLDGQTATCEVVVEEDLIPIESITLRQDVITTYVGLGYQLFANINPDKTTDSTELTWTTDDITVAYVSANGKVIGVNPGTTTVYATSTNGTSVACEVTVEEELPIHTTIMNFDLYDARFLKEAEVLSEFTKFENEGKYTDFVGNAILNRLWDAKNVEKWLRIQARDKGDQSYIVSGISGNYWGTTNNELINHQIIDFDDFQQLIDLIEGEYLTEAPITTYPYVVDAYLEVDKEKVDIVGNQEVTFVVKFNRPMNVEKDVTVKFGSSYPYAEYEINGEFVSETEWRGTYKLTTIIENGYQYITVEGGEADNGYKLFTDRARFEFKIDTTAAQALIMQAVAEDTGIKLTWQQDDFATLAGYNVYRSTSLDGYYERINKTVIPADTKEFFDDTVEPGVIYYYNFTVVQTDLNESEPSGKVVVRSKDTMAPNIYHSPVYNAFTGSDLVISATVTDNLKLDQVALYYRVTGESDYKVIIMNNVNDKYSAIINAAYITTAGLEYYIDAYDGVSHTYKGSATDPYQVTVQVAVGANEKGDVDGNGIIEIKDAMMLLMHRNGKINLSAVEFARADIDGDGVLDAMEALRIIQFANGKIPSVLF